ncbi:MAG: TlpA family protein disulfide reductase [Candidatus Dormibacteraeota bacterium]|nr:TlpA family protein disulfide reductase [Candidatus Dormibacteraeota bacterium]
MLAAPGLAACGAGGQAPKTETLPAGFSLRDETRLGFQVGLPQGWRESARTEQGVTFTDGASGVVLVAFDQAISSNLDDAGRHALLDLTQGTGLSRVTESTKTVDGRPAKRFDGSFGASGAAQDMNAVITLNGDRVWSLVLVGPTERVLADQKPFAGMLQSFHIKGIQASAAPKAAAGLPAPPFPALSTATLRDHPVVLNFFATWCVDCQAELPLLRDRAAAGRGRYTVLLIDAQETQPDRVPAYLRNLDVSFPVAYDSDGKIAASYGLPGVPTSYFLDSKHVLRTSAVGKLDAARLEAGLKAAGAV